MKNEQDELAALMAQSPDGMTTHNLMQLIAVLIDAGSDAGSMPALNRAQRLLDHLEAETLSPREQCRTHYFRANLWSGRRHISAAHREWHWKSEAIDGEILELRRALAHPGFYEHNKLEMAQIYTNLGNILNHVGRFVEAIEYWDRALLAVPGFAMAHGNRGTGLAYYATSLYDPGHSGVLMFMAYDAFCSACSDDAINENPENQPALDAFSLRARDIETHLDIGGIANTIDLINHPIGQSKAERAYRQWCINERLFLNPLNDIGPNPIAAQDVMTLPTITTTLDGGWQPPPVIHYFNGLKQEFCAARFALYEASTQENVHYSDRRILIYDTLNFAMHGFAVERTKMAFRGAYALFDKIGFLLNEYLLLGHAERQVNFRNLWFVKGKGKELHPSLDGLPNWPLRGLFWLSKDIFEDDFRTVTEPDAQVLYELRNHMEHKFVSVYDGFCRVISPNVATTPEIGVIDVSFDELMIKTLRQLKLARAALIYLSLGIHAEERRRAAARGDDELVAGMPLHPVNDSAKRRW